MKKKSLLLLIPFAAAAAVALGSCGKEPGPQCDQASVILDSQAITIEINETKQLTASSNMEGCSVEVNWRSDDASIASVDQNGVVTGHKNGTTTVYANDVPCLVAVGTGRPDIPITGIELVKPASDSITMVVGDTQEVIVNVLPNEAPASDKVVNLSSSKESVVIINENGEIEAVGAGTAKVTITSEKNPDVKKVISITVEEPVIPFPLKTSDDATLVDVGPVLDGATVNFVGRHNNEYFAMDHEQTKASSSVYFKSIAATVDNDKLLLGEGSGSFFTIKNKDGSYSFKTASGKYLAAKSDKNQLLEVDAIGPDSSFNIEIVDGEATITCIDPANTEHNTLFLNQGSERFACYKSTQTYPKPHIYAKAPVPVPATGILLDKSEATIEIDGEFTLVPEVLPSYAIDKTVTWTTENKGIVSVDNGKVKGLMAGEEIVTASTVNGKTATCKITVVSEIVPVDRIELNNTTMTLDIDDVSESLTATVFPENATFKDVVWSSSEEDIVKVDETGKLTAVGVGASTITVTSTTDSSKTASCVVSVNAASDGIVHAYEAAMAMEPGTGGSEKAYTITGKVTFMPGNNLIIQDGDHSIIVYKSGQSGTNFKVGDTVTMRCQVQNYDGAAETVSLSNNDVKVIEKDVAVNKATIDSSAKMEAADFSIIADFKNVIKKSELTLKASTGDYSMDVVFKDNLDVKYTFFMKKNLVSQSVIDEINTVMIDGEIEITNCYVGNFKGARQLCTGTESVVTDKTVYVPDTVHVKNGESEITALNMVEGDVVNLTANILPVKAPQEVTWSTEDTEIISVDNGKITALKAGDATLVVTSADGTKNTNISVKVTTSEVFAESVELDEEAITLSTDETKQLTATVSPDTVTHPDIVWSVSEGEGVVSVDENGLVTALTPGTAAVKALNPNSGKFDTCSFTVIQRYVDVSEKDTYALTKENLGLTNSYTSSEPRADIAFTSIAYDDAIKGNGDSKYKSEIHNAYPFSKEIKYIKLVVAADKADVTCEVSTGSSVQPTADPVVIGDSTHEIVAGAKYIIYPEDGATFFNMVYTGNSPIHFSTIEIGFVDYNVPLEGIELNKESLSLVVEESFMLEATLNPSDTTHTTLTYSSDHPEIANVGTDGIISAYAPGTAIITVATDDPEISATCEVKVVETKVPVTKVELTDHKTEILQGGCTTLTATVSPDNATITDLIWSVEEGKEDIISVEDGCVSGLKPGTAKVIVKSVDNPAAFDECEVTVEERFIDVSTMDEYVITAESLGLIEDYASDSSEYFAWTQAKADKSGNIQISGSTSPKSELHNLFGFSKDITYIVIDLASGATENATADLRFGDSVLPTENAVNLGKDTKYPLNVEGKIVIMAPEEGFDFFSLAPTKNAVYIKSITVGFDEYVEHVTGVSLDKETTILEEGASEQLTATVSPDNASDKSVTWTSSNDLIATVDSNGNVTAVSAGEAIITAKTTDGEFEAKCTVTVIEKVIDVENITLDKETLELVEGKNSTLVATITPDDATYPEHTWSSSDESVVKVDQDGKVTAVAPGTATITVKVDGDETKYAECAVTVTAIVKQDLPYNGSFAWDSEAKSAVFPEGNWTGNGTSFSSTCYCFSGANQSVQAVKLFNEAELVQVDVTSIVNASAEADRLVTVYGLNDAGEVVTSATFVPDYANASTAKAAKENATVHSVTLNGDGITGIKIEYTKASSKLVLLSVDIADIGKVTDVELGEHDLELLVGNTGTLTATVSPETALNKEVTFESDNEDAVTVDASTGAYEAIGVGSAKITVTTTDGSYKDTCNIIVSAKERTMTGLTVEGPTKVEYTEGETLNLEGLIVKAIYDSGDPKVITEGYTTNIALDHPLELTDTSLVVSYNDFDADAITLTINKAPAIIKEGYYYISSVADGTTYYLQSNGTSSAPLAVTNIEDATMFKFTLVEGLDDTYKITLADDSSKFLYVNGANNDGLRIGGTEDSWTISEGTISGTGSYDIVDTAQTRMLSLYNNKDFRSYGSTSGSKKSANLTEAEYKEVSSITVTTQPNKTTYYVGDPFDPTGMVVHVVYADGDEADITKGFTWAPKTFEALNDEKDVTITFGGKNAHIKVAVVEDERTLTGIEFAEGSDMTKKEYKEGDTWDSTGITVNDVYSDDSREAAEGVSLSFNPASPAVGTTQVIVTATKEGCDPVSMTVTGISVAELPKNIDEIDATDFSELGTSYKTYVDVSVTTEAKYNAYLAYPSGASDQIQMQKTNSYIGTSNSQRFIKSISFDFATAQTMNVYASMDGFVDKSSCTAANLVGTVSSESPTFTFEDNYLNFMVVNTSGGAAKIKTITVTWDETKLDKYVSDVSLDKEEATMNVGEPLTLTPTVKGFGENYDALTWSSNNESKVTVENGVLTAHEATDSPVIITATSVADPTKSASCLITVKAARSFTELTTTGGFKTSYKTTDTAFAVNDLKVYANYSDSSKEEVTDYTVTWSETFSAIAGEHASIPTIHWDGHDLVLSEVSYTVSAPAAKTSDLVFPSGETIPTGWSTSYAAHTVENDDFAVAFADASYNAPSSGTAWDSKHPTSKTGALTVSLKIDAKITGFSLECLQWGTNAKTISYQYTINGTDWVAGTATSSNFSLKVDSLPDGVVGLKFATTNTSKQIGFVSLSLNLLA